MRSDDVFITSCTIHPHRTMLPPVKTVQDLFWVISLGHHNHSHIIRVVDNIFVFFFGTKLWLIEVSVGNNSSQFVLFSGLVLLIITKFEWNWRRLILVTTTTMLFVDFTCTLDTNEMKTERRRGRATYWNGRHYWKIQLNSHRLVMCRKWETMLEPHAYISQFQQKSIITFHNLLYGAITETSTNTFGIVYFLQWNCKLCVKQIRKCERNGKKRGNVS